MVWGGATIGVEPDPVGLGPRPGRVASLELAEQFPGLSKPTARGRDLLGVSAVPIIAVSGAGRSAAAIALWLGVIKQLGK